VKYACDHQVTPITAVTSLGVTVNLIILDGGELITALIVKEKPYL
jgi:hypothetical protein